MVVKGKEGKRDNEQALANETLGIIESEKRKTEQHAQEWRDA